MSAHGWLLLGLYLAILLATVKPFGSYIAEVMDGRGVVPRLGRGIEGLGYRLCGIDKDEEMSWLKYAFALSGRRITAGIGWRRVAK